MTSHPFSLERNRGLYLGFFFFSNFLIAYSALPLGFKLTLGLFGILLPLYVGVRTSTFPNTSTHPDSSLDLKLSTPLWFLLAGVGLAVFLRFYKLTTVFCWPTLDEGWNGILALELSKDWNWRFFYTFGDAPPLPVWFGALLFKAGASPALALWLPSAVVSCLTVAAGYLAARQFFSKSFALVCGGLLAFSYWPLFMGRFCHQGIWLPLWICGFLYLWGRFQTSNNEKDRKIWAIASGVGLGLGSFTFTPWIGAAGLLFLWVFWTLWLGSKTPWTRSKARPSPQRAMLFRPGVPKGFNPFGLFKGHMGGSPHERKRRDEGRVRGNKYFLLFLAGLVLALLPFLLAVLREGYGHHIRSLSPWGGWFKEFQVVTGFFKYFAVMIWGAYEKDPAYTPVWGGFLNPPLASFFFLGLGEMIRRWRSGIVQWVGAFFLLFLLPGALSPNLEAFRVAQVMPLLLVVVAFGIHPFLGSLPSSRRLWALGLILAFTGAFDFNQLAKPYRDPSTNPVMFGRPLKSLERYRSWQILEDLRSKGEPASGIMDFGADSIHDPTLLLMIPPNPGFSGRVPWGAVSANAHFEPFLKKRFPGGKWLWVGKDLMVVNGGRLLGLIPREGSDQPTLDRWFHACEAMNEADVTRFSQNSGKLDAPVSILSYYYPLVKGDPFLESVYWDKMAAYAYENLDYEAQLKCYQMAVKRGYPTADLYFKLGQMYLVGKRVKEAKEAFVMATQAPMDRTQAKQVLEWMDRTEKTEPGASRP